MNKNTLITLILVLLLIVTVGVLANRNVSDSQNTQSSNDRSGENEQTETDTTQTINDTEIGYSLSYPETFAALTESEQDILPSLGYIPPCDENHSNCLYYIGTEFEGTNFDSAGISIQNISETDAETCTSFVNTHRLPESEISTEDINGSTFHIAKSGDAGAGHMAEETVYRTYHNNTCVEIVTRIGYSQFGNYPEGSVEEFTNEDRDELMGSMREVVRTFSF